ncbi:MAG: hypothetical protein ACTSUE_20670 [Promethearchaeota archaeon]
MKAVTEHGHGFDFHVPDAFDVGAVEINNKVVDSFKIKGNHLSIDFFNENSSELIIQVEFTPNNLYTES